MAEAAALRPAAAIAIFCHSPIARSDVSGGLCSDPPANRISSTVQRPLAWRNRTGAPGVAARLHLSIACAFHQRSDFDFARREYDAADRLFARAGEGDSDDAAVGRLGRIAMESVSGQPDRLEGAGRLLAREKARLGARGETGRVGFALAQAEGSVGYSTDLAVAESAFRRAIAVAEAPDSLIAAPQLLKIRSSLALTLMRQGRPREAEPLARTIVADSIRVRGADHPDTLVTRQHLLTSLVMQGKAEEALQGSGPLLATMQARFGPDHRFTLGTPFDAVRKLFRARSLSRGRARGGASVAGRDGTGRPAIPSGARRADRLCLGPLPD